MRDPFFSNASKALVSAIGVPHAATDPEALHTISESELRTYIDVCLKFLRAERPLPDKYATPILDAVIAWREELTGRGFQVNLNVIPPDSTDQKLARGGE